MAPYKAPTMFAALDTAKGERRRRAAVEEEMVAAIQAGTFCLTDALNQGEASRHVRQIILGESLDTSNGQTRTGQRIPPAVSGHRVKLQRVGGRGLKWKTVPEIDESSRNARGNARGNAGDWYVETWYVATKAGLLCLPADEAQDVTADAETVELPLDEALRALDWAGENVKYYKRKVHQAAGWCFREVRMTEPERRGPGRPRKTETTEASL